MNKMKEGVQSIWVRAIKAGFIAITINTILLKSAPIFDVHAGEGGLLKLWLLIYGEITTVPAALHSLWFAMLFKYLSGFLLVLIYVYLFAPLLPMLQGWLKGTIFSFFLWLINSFIVFPMLGSKIFGYDQISPAGLIFFFFANGIFGVLTGWLYERGQKKYTIKTRN